MMDNADHKARDGMKFMTMDELTHTPEDEKEFKDFVKWSKENPPDDNTRPPEEVIQSILESR